MRNPFRPFSTQLAQSLHGVLYAALEVISGIATAPGATLTALTMASGDTLTVRQGNTLKQAQLLNFWTVNQAAGASLVKSPRMHDNTQGIRAVSTTTSFSPAMPFGWGQPLQASDVLTAQISGSAVGGQIEQMALLLYYDNLDAANGRFITSAQLSARGKNMMTVRTTNAFGAAGGWSGSVAINSTDDNGKAGVDYAVIGYKVSALCGAVAYHGFDTGNLRVGGPGYLANPFLTERWFIALSDEYGLPLIPVMNWTNKAGFLVDGTQDNNGTSVTVTTYLVELGA